MSLARLRHEWPLLASVVTAALFLAFGKGWVADLSSPAWFAFIFAWLVAVVLVSAFAIVRHAESLAELLGEPLGTLILTLSVTGIEVMLIAAAMSTGSGSPALARDAMFAVVMIVLNGMIGLTLILGGLKHREQVFNLQGANAFLAVIVPLAVLGLVLPSFTQATPGPVFSPLQATFLSIMSIALYGVFLAIQNVRHREYFVHSAAGVDEAGDGTHVAHDAHSSAYHAGFLVAYLLPLVILSKQLAVPIEHGIQVLGAPAALGGLLVALVVLSPESMSAVRAALANQLQRSVNILLGSVLATIGLTIPAVLIIGLVTGKAIVLGLDPVDTTMLALTLIVSINTFSASRTNVLLGVVHTLLFFAYLMLIFER
jgi:Ca2+:H+ antiporter